MASAPRFLPVHPVTSGRELEASERLQLPAGFDAVGEALVSGVSPLAACGVAGRELARDGASLGEALSGLRATYAALGGAVPDVEAVEVLAIGWSEAASELLDGVSCEDPLTGMSSMLHLRSRLDEVYREAERSGRSARGTHALVVLDLTESAVPADGAAVFARALSMVAVADVLRMVFSGEETIARAARDRVVVLVRRESTLGASLAQLRALFEDRRLEQPAALWLEGLPERGTLGRTLLAELTH